MIKEKAENIKSSKKLFVPESSVGFIASMERQTSTEWVDIGKGLGNSFPITDIVIVNKKEKSGEYHVVSFNCSSCCAWYY